MKMGKKRLESGVYGSPAKVVFIYKGQKEGLERKLMLEPGTAGWTFVRQVTNQLLRRPRHVVGEFAYSKNRQVLSASIALVERQRFTS